MLNMNAFTPSWNRPSKPLPPSGEPPPPSNKPPQPPSGRSPASQPSLPGCAPGLRQPGAHAGAKRGEGRSIRRCRIVGGAEALAGAGRGKSRSTCGCQAGEGQKYTRVSNRFRDCRDKSRFIGGPQVQRPILGQDVACRTSYGGAHRLYTAIGKKDWKIRWCRPGSAYSIFLTDTV